MATPASETKIVSEISNTPPATTQESSRFAVSSELIQQWQKLKESLTALSSQSIHGWTAYRDDEQMMSPEEATNRCTFLRGIADTTRAQESARQQLLLTMESSAKPQDQIFALMLKGANLGSDIEYDLSDDESDDLKEKSDTVAIAPIDKIITEISLLLFSQPPAIASQFVVEAQSLAEKFLKKNTDFDFKGQDFKIKLNALFTTILARAKVSSLLQMGFNMLLDKNPPSSDSIFEQLKSLFETVPSDSRGKLAQEALKVTTELNNQTGLSVIEGSKGTKDSLFNEKAMSFFSEFLPTAKPKLAAS